MLSAAYLAGFFDGEGAVIISKNNKSSGYKFPTYALVISITQADKDFVDELKEQFCGGIYQCATKGKTVSGRTPTRDAWQWRIGSTKAEPFINYIYPHVRLKQDQLDVALRFIEHLKQNPATGARMGPVHNQGVHEQRRRIAEAKDELRNELLGLRAPAA